MDAFCNVPGHRESDGEFNDDEGTHHQTIGLLDANKRCRFEVMIRLLKTTTFQFSRPHCLKRFANRLVQEYGPSVLALATDIYVELDLTGGSGSEMLIQWTDFFEDRSHGLSHHFPHLARLTMPLPAHRYRIGPTRQLVRAEGIETFSNARAYSFAGLRDILKHNVTVPSAVVRGLCAPLAEELAWEMMCADKSTPPN
jgi:hypothetical protein